MQRTWLNRVKRILPFLLVFLIILFLIAFDQSTKTYIKNIYENEGWRGHQVIEDFAGFTYVVNTGAAWSFLADVSWAQTFFKILTPIATIVFVCILIYAIIKKYKLLTISFVLIISGTIGNFIDRIKYSGVVDFISFIFGDYAFPVFNVADSYMTIGIILLVIHFLFLDNNAIFKKNGKEDI